MSKLATIERWKRRVMWETSPALGADPDTVVGTVYTPHGMVQAFSYRGGVHGPAYTLLAMYLVGYEYRERRPLSYGRLSLMRMARRFAARCAAMAERQG